MPKNNRLLLRVTSGILLVALIVFLARSWHVRTPDSISIATGTKGGTYAVLGERLARILEERSIFSDIPVQAIETHGSGENIDLLLRRRAEMALAMKPSITFLNKSNSENLRKLRVMARLYTDVIQIVVRKDAEIHSLADLSGKRVYVGAEKSATKIVAEKILGELGIEPAFEVTTGGYYEASLRLIKGELDAAVFVAGTPAEAVKMALESGNAELLDLGAEPRLSLILKNDFLPEDIPADTYASQTIAVHTFGSDVLLLCHKDLSPRVVEAVLDALFDHVDELLYDLAGVGDIRLREAFDETRLPTGVVLHTGAKNFIATEARSLLIATGTITGKYYNTGKIIHKLVEQRRITARVIDTDGSIANARLLVSEKKRTVAIMQYDVALAAYWGTDPDMTVVRGMRRIASLYKEQVHVLIRRDKLGNREPTLRSIKDVRTSIGLPGSGTQFLIKAILSKLDIELQHPVGLSVPDMVDKLHSGEIDAGIFVSFVPSDAVKTLVDNPDLRLLTIDPEDIKKLISPAYMASTIEAGTYNCQQDDEPAIRTIATRAVLVTTAELDKNVGKITSSIIDGAALLEIAEVDLALELSSIPTHPAAERAYQRRGVLPSKPNVFEPFFDWLSATWRLLAILVMVLAGYKSAIEVRRAGTRNSFGRSILKVPIEGNAEASIKRLTEIRKDILDAVRRRYWHTLELNQGRWRYLEYLIDDRIRRIQDESKSGK